MARPWPPDLWARYERPVWLALTLVGATILAWLLLSDGRGFDARSYHAIDHDAPYALAWGNVAVPIAFRYSPAVLVAFLPFTGVPWAVWLAGWTVLLLACLWFVLRRWTLAAFAFYPVVLEMSVANVHIVMAAALVAGLRWPATWMLLPLTKATPGVLWLWWVARGEWRQLGVAVGVTLVVVLGSATILGPGIWLDWLGMLNSSTGGQSGGLSQMLSTALAIRLLLAAALVWWAGRTDRAWVLPFALVLSLPTIWIAGLAMLVAVIPLRLHHAVDADRAGRDVARGHAEPQGRDGGPRGDPLHAPYRKLRGRAGRSHVLDRPLDRLAERR